MYFHFFIVNFVAHKRPTAKSTLYFVSRDLSGTGLVLKSRIGERFQFRMAARCRVCTESPVAPGGQMEGARRNHGVLLSHASREVKISTSVSIFKDLLV